MKANFFTESILYSIARGLSLSAQKLPPSWSDAFGAGVGRVLYHTLGKRKAMALGNLRAAFEAEYAPEEYDKILKDMFAHLGQMFMEIARIPVINKDYVDRWIDTPDGAQERVEKLLEEGKGILFVTAHLGNWEIGSITSALHGFPMMVLAREQGWPKLNRMLTNYREMHGCKVITKGFPIREMVQGLRENKIVAILSDQDGGARGVFGEFFGRLASTAQGVVSLSLRTGAPVVPVFVDRIQGSRHQVIFHEALEIPETGTEEERIRQGTQNYLKVLEQAIRNHPSQWLWLHRRWKSSPQKRVLLFSDGKAGHDAQLQGFVQRLTRVWTAKKQEDPRLEPHAETPLVQAHKVQVEYKQPWRRGVLSLVAALCKKSYGGGRKWLRWALTPKSYASMCSAYADWAVSCGSSTSAVNLLWSWEIRSKTVQLNKSPLLKRFDLAVLTQHDAESVDMKKACVIPAALTPLWTVTSEQEQAWRDQLGIADPKPVGVLLGAPIANMNWDPQEAQDLVATLLQWAEAQQRDLLLTTSRRTSVELEQALAKMLESSDRVKLVTLANQGKTGGLGSTQEAMPCLLSLCSDLVVSGDSISMVSEAVATDSAVYVFGKQAGTKHERFLESLDARSAIERVDAESIVETLAAQTHKATQAKEDALEKFLVDWL